MLKRLPAIALTAIAAALLPAAGFGAGETGSAVQPQTRSMEIMGWDHKIDSPRDAPDSARRKQPPVKTGPAVIAEPADDKNDQVGKFREPTKHPAKQGPLPANRLY